MLTKPEHGYIKFHGYDNMLWGCIGICFLVSTGEILRQSKCLYPKHQTALEKNQRHTQHSAFLYNQYDFKLDVFFTTNGKSVHKNTV